MTDRNAQRLGYKKTPVGWIPAEWECLRLKRIIGELEAGSSVDGEDRQRLPNECAVLKVSAVSGDAFRSSEHKVIASDVAAAMQFTPRRHEVLISRANTFDLVGRAVWLDRDWPNLFLSDKLWQTQLVAKGQCHTRWLAYMISSSPVRRAVVSRATGTSGSMKNISQASFLAIAVPLPHLAEQKKIAAILSAWDEAIEQTHALVVAARRRKTALMQQMLTGERRLVGYGKKWAKKSLRELTERITDSPPSTDGYPVLSITAGTGFVSQEEKFSRVIAGRHIEHYVLLRKGEFAYNKGNSYRFPQGCAYRLHEYDAGLVPDVFFSFRVRPNAVVPEFIEQFFLSGMHGEQLRRWVNTGVRNNGLLNLNAKDFFNLLVPCSEMKEQSAIAALLTTADDEIESLEANCAALARQKKGLMQKLLTGEVRVKP